MYQRKSYLGNTMVQMADGSTKPIENVRIGDMVLAKDGNPKSIVNVFKGMEMVYELETDDYKNDIIVEN